MLSKIFHKRRYVVQVVVPYTEAIKDKDRPANFRFFGDYFMPVYKSREAAEKDWHGQRIEELETKKPVKKAKR